MAAMAGAPINFTNPTGGIGNGNGLLGLPSNAGLLGGIAAGLNSAIDSYRTERQYRTSKEQQQKENQMKQQQYQLQLAQSGFQQGQADSDGNQKLEYSPEKIAMGIAATKYEGLKESQAAKQKAFDEYLKAGGDPTKSPFKEDIFSPVPLQDWRNEMRSKDQPTQGGLLPSSPMKYAAQADGSYGAPDKEAEQYAANNSGPAPSGNLPPKGMQSVGTEGLDAKPKADFSGLLGSPQRKKLIADTTKAQNEAAESSIKLRDPYQHLGDVDKKQVDDYIKAIPANNMIAQKLQDAVDTLKDPNAKAGDKLDKVNATVRLLQNSPTVGGQPRVSADEIQEFKRLVSPEHGFRLYPDPGVGPNFKRQAEIFEDKIKDLKSDTEAYKSNIKAYVPSYQFKGGTSPEKETAENTKKSLPQGSLDSPGWNAAKAARYQELLQKKQLGASKKKISSSQAGLLGQ